MKVFIGRNALDEPLENDIHICVDATLQCPKRTKTPCSFCVTVPPTWDWRMYLKRLREKLNEIPYNELR